MLFKVNGVRAMGEALLCGNRCMDALSQDQLISCMVSATLNCSSH